MAEDLAAKPHDVFIIDGVDIQKSTTPEDFLINYQHNPFHNLEEKNYQPKNVRVVRKLAQWTDPFTLPHTRLDCVKECHITPWDKWCCGWALRKQFMEVELFVEVRTATDQDIVDALEDCLRQSAIASALAAIVAAVYTGGAALSAAESTFVAVLTECLSKKLQNIITVRLYTASHWGPWK